MKPDVAISANGGEFIPIHFIYSSPVGLIEGEGKPLSALGNSWKIACMPGILELSARGSKRRAPILRSDDPRAVTCPLCKSTERYKNAAASLVEDR